MPHPWLIASPDAALPEPASLEKALLCGEPPLALHDDLGPAGTRWESLGFALPGHPPNVYVEAEPVDGETDWLAQAELARWRRALGALPASAGRREALQRLTATRWLLAVHLMPVPAAGSALWLAGERLATALAAAPGTVLWVAGEGSFLDGVAVPAWS
jgi:hypothetical protein